MGTTLFVLSGCAFLKGDGPGDEDGDEDGDEAETAESASNEAGGDAAPKPREDAEAAPGDSAPGSTASSDAAAAFDADRWLPPEQAKFTVPDGAVTTIYENVVYHDEAVVFAGAAADAIAAHDEAKGEYRFDAAKLEAAGAKLEKGTAFMIPGLALRKVASVSTDGGQLVVTTQPASLNEVIKDGTVGWKAKLPLDPQHVVGWVDQDGLPLPAKPVPSPAGGTAHGVMASIPPSGTSSARLSGWSTTVPDALMAPPSKPGRMKWTFNKAGIGYEMELEARGDEAKVLIKATKASGGNTEMQYWAKGTFKQVYVNAKGEYKDGEVRSLEYDQPEMVGDFEIAIAAAGSGNNEINFKMPEAVLRYVYPAGPIPVVVEVKAQMIGRVKVPSKGSAMAKSKFSYSGHAGFTYKGTDVEAKGVFNKVTMSPDPFDSAANIGQSVDAQWGVGVPRVSVSAFGTFLVPFIQPGITIGSKLQWGPVCKSGYVRFNVIAGYDFGVMGVKFAEDKIKLYEKQKNAPEGGCK